MTHGKIFKQERNKRRSQKYHISQIPNEYYVLINCQTEEQREYDEITKKISNQKFQKALENNNFEYIKQHSNIINKRVIIYFDYFEDDGQYIYPLDYALQIQNPPMIKFLIELGAKHNFGHFLTILKCLNIDLIKFFVNDLNYNIDFNQLIRDGIVPNYKLMKCFVEEFNIKPNITDHFINNICFTNDFDLIKYIIEHFNVDACTIHRTFVLFVDFQLIYDRDVLYRRYRHPWDDNNVNPYDISDEIMEYLIAKSNPITKNANS